MKYSIGLLLFLLSIGTIGFSGGVVFHAIEPPLPQINGNFGEFVSGVGDADGDGYDDILVGAFKEYGGITHSGKAYLYSGENGGLLDQLLSPDPEMWGWFGTSGAGIDDIDGDGCADLLIGACRENGGASYSGRVHIFSGQAGEPMYSLQSLNPVSSGWFGYSVSGAGDVDADGSPDVVIGATYEDAPYNRSGRAYVFDGFSGNLKYDLKSPNAIEDGCFGVAVCGIGDVDGDGCGDIAVGAQNDHGPATYSGRVYVFSGCQGALIRALQSPLPESVGAFGGSIASAGDITGDGVPDIIVGAWAQDGGAEDAGRVYVFCGQTGAVIHMLESPAPENGGYFGLQVSALSDVNGDGYPDIAVGACREDATVSGSGRVYLFCGKTGNLLYPLESLNPDINGQFGYSLSDGPDMNCNGFPDIIVGATGENTASVNSGRVYVMELMPVTFPVSHSLIDGSLELQWDALPGTEFHWVFGESNHTYFDPDIDTYVNRIAVLPGAQTTWSSSSGIGSEAEQWSYVVIAVDEMDLEISRSMEIGEFDFCTPARLNRSPKKGTR